MNKLFKLKEWLTLEETARRLTTSFQEPVTIADCLQLALDGHITISVLFEDSKYGVLCKEELFGTEMLIDFVNFMKESGKFSYEEIENAERSIDTYPRDMVFKHYGDVFKLRGIYDLTMKGAERLDILYKCSILQGREPVDFICLDGPIITNGNELINIIEPFDKNNIEWKINDNLEHKLFNKKDNKYIDQHNFHSAFYPADGLREAEIIFRRKNIENFESQQLEESSSELKITIDGCLEIIGSILDALKNTPTKNKRWTQDGLKNEMIENCPSLRPRSIDDYFSQANKSYKTKS